MTFCFDVNICIIGQILWEKLRAFSQITVFVAGLMKKKSN